MTLQIGFDKPSYLPTDTRTMTITAADGSRITTANVTVDLGAAGKGTQPYNLFGHPTVTDDSGAVWQLKSDDGKVAVYTFTPGASSEEEPEPIEREAAAAAGVTE